MIYISSIIKNHIFISYKNKMSSLVDVLVTALSSNMDTSSPDDLQSLRDLVQNAVDSYAVSGSGSSSGQTTGGSSGKRVKSVRSSRATGKPSKMNPYHYFVKCNMHTVVNEVKEPKQRMSHIGNLWKQLSDTQKAEYATYSESHNAFVASNASTFADSKELEREAVRSALAGSRFEAVAELVAKASAPAETTSTVVTAVPVPAPAPVQAPVVAPTPAPAPAQGRRVARRN